MYSGLQKEEVWNEFINTKRTMAGIDFDYGEFFRFFNNGQNPETQEMLDNIVVRIYESDYVAMKYDREEKLTPFVNRGVTVRRSPVDVQGARYGTFVVTHLGSNSQKKMYVVTPQNIRGYNVDSPKNLKLIAANHYSFLLNRGDKRGLPLHFHKTMYLATSEDCAAGVCNHTPSHLPSQFQLERLPDLLNDKLKHEAPKLLRLFGAPWSQSRGHRENQDGGSRGSRSNRRRRQRQRRREGQPGESFADIWRRLPLHRVLVFAVKSPTEGQDHDQNQDREFDVTVFLHDRLRHELNLRQGFAFRASRGEVQDEELLQGRLAQRMTRMKWDDFYDVIVDSDFGSDDEGQD
jgi:hypothetical protein